MTEANATDLHREMHASPDQILDVLHGSVTPAQRPRVSVRQPRPDENPAGASVNDERGRIQDGLCFMPIGGLPIGDVMLAQKIALETCESEVRRGQEVHP